MSLVSVLMVFRAADPEPEYGVKEQPHGTKVTLVRTKAQLMGQDSSDTTSSPESIIGITSIMGAMSNTGIMASNHYYQLSILPVSIMASTHHDNHPLRSTFITASCETILGGPVLASPAGYTRLTGGGRMTLVSSPS